MNVSVSMAKAVRWSGIGRTLAQVFRWAMTLIVIRILMRRITAWWRSP